MSEKEMIRPKKPKIEGNKVKPSDESPSIDLQKEEIISSLYHAKSKINHSLKPLEKDFKPFPETETIETKIDEKKKKTEISEDHLKEKQQQQEIQKQQEQQNKQKKIQKEINGIIPTVFKPFPTVTESETVISHETSTSIPYEKVEPVEDTIEQLKKAKENPINILESEYENLSPLEKDILEIAKSVLKKKKYDSKL
ncbi:MAG: hypothetical protein ACTSXY_04070, partial [Promethearchaeota archaeon]